MTLLIIIIYLQISLCAMSQPPEKLAEGFPLPLLKDIQLYDPVLEIHKVSGFRWASEELGREATGLFSRFRGRSLVGGTQSSAAAQKGEEGSRHARYHAATHVSFRCGTPPRAAGIGHSLCRTAFHVPCG